MKGWKMTYYVFGILLLAGCAVSRQAKDNTSLLLDKKWRLIELDGKAISGKVNGQIPYIKFLTEDGRYEANGGCNGIGGEFKLSGKGGIEIKPGMSTMMYCEDMSIEHGLKQLFAAIDSYEVDQNILILSKKGGATKAKFSLWQDNSEALIGTWELDYISGSKIALDGLFPGKKPTINFDLDEGRVNGNGGCNNYNGSVEINETKIKFGPLMSTKMACEGNGEAVFFSTMQKVNTFSVDEKTLQFIMGDIVIMRFQRK
ncbi:META domain-containing protein [Sphingobacterium sp. LRF_L2]|uniref:META domain-containing protein n=1 Tax=Sphingobacterium sp. LRF_L2 TaxID=3369421 RepID=UPI003F634B32